MDDAGDPGADLFTHVDQCELDVPRDWRSRPRRSGNPHRPRCGPTLRSGSPPPAPPASVRPRLPAAPVIRTTGRVSLLVWFADTTVTCRLAVAQRTLEASADGHCSGASASSKACRMAHVRFCIGHGSGNATPSYRPIPSCTRSLRLQIRHHSRLGRRDTNVSVHTIVRSPSAPTLMGSLSTRGPPDSLGSHFGAAD